MFFFKKRFLFLIVIVYLLKLYISIFFNMFNFQIDKILVNIINPQLNNIYPVTARGANL